ncbi:MAG: sporulation protein YunB [Clostridia bacterium]
MRLKYYMLTLRQMSFKKPFVFFLIVMFTMLISTFIVNNNLKPTIQALCESQAKNIALKATNKAIHEEIISVKYDDLISFQKDNNGKILALNANVMQMKGLTSEISSGIMKEILNNKEGQIQVPLGSFFGMKIIGGYGPKLKIKTIPTGDINVSFKSEFENAGINQTKHKIYIDITTNVKIIAPFYTNVQSFHDNITVAETIIVGDTPTSYYNINGMDVKDALKITK